MKKIITLPLLFMCSLLFSQNTMTTNCQTTYTDTIEYVSQIKSTDFLPLGINSVNDGGSYGYAGFGQRFEAPDTVEVLGFTFSAWVNTGASDSVTCRLYTTTVDGLPDTQIDSVIHWVQSVPGFVGELDSSMVMNTVMFDTSHLIEGDYIISVENFGTSDMYITRNAVGDGNTDGECVAYYRGLVDPTWDGWYIVFDFSASWDFDMNFSPIIKYKINTETTISVDTICSGEEVTMSTSIVSFDDSLLYHKMYNPNFATYDGYSKTTNYNYGDGISDGSGVHSYTGFGSYIISMTDTITTSSWSDTIFLVTCNDTIFMDNCTDIDEINGDDLTIYPNPTINSFTIIKQGNYELSIFDNQGKLVMSKQMEGTQTVDISMLEYGMYVINISNGNHHTYKKLQVLN